MYQTPHDSKPCLSLFCISVYVPNILAATTTVKLGLCPKTCRNENCDKTTKDCTEGCVKNYYGIHCDKVCNDNCAGNECEQSEGGCKDCVKQTYGKYCTQTCVNCENGCKQDTGECNGKIYRI